MDEVVSYIGESVYLPRPLINPHLAENGSLDMGVIIEDEAYQAESVICWPEDRVTPW
jgi:hypothetical protein